MPLAIIQRVFGTITRSSGFCTPQMNVSPPDGAHADVWAASIESELHRSRKRSA